MREPEVCLFMENGVEICLRLFPALAPNTVRSFLYLAQLGVYDGHAIERIVPGYVVDASYHAFHRAEAKYLIANEAHPKGEGPALAPGVIAMGGYGADGIAGGEFFFPLAKLDAIEGQYPVFGQVTQGLEEILRWETLPLLPVEYPENPCIVINAPADPLIIQKVTVETFGVQYDPPETLSMPHRPPSW